MSHTPGPWSREGRTVYALESVGFRKGIEQFQNRFDAHVQGPHTTPTEEQEANAQLIAAAPDLLVALKGFYDSGVAMVDFLKMAEAAISKATGA